MSDNRAQELIDTIRFYADPANYVTVHFVEPPTSAIKADGGLRARSFLKQFEAVD